MRKQYAKIKHYCSVFTVAEGTPKVLNIQEEVTNLLEENTPPPSVVKIAPPFLEELRNISFTGTSTKREDKQWKYWAIAVNVDTKRKIITEDEGSAQVGELVAL